MKSSHRKEETMFTLQASGASLEPLLEAIRNSPDLSRYLVSVSLEGFPAALSRLSATASPRGEPSTPQKPEDKPESSEGGSPTIKEGHRRPVPSFPGSLLNWSKRE
jgi:hypothetical protein